MTAFKIDEQRRAIFLPRMKLGKLNRLNLIIIRR